MGTQKNRLNETVLLSTQNTCLNWWVRKKLQFYAKIFAPQLAVWHKCFRNKCILCFIHVSGKNPLSYTCDNVLRAQSFDDYYMCTCPDGWEGIHCEQDVDECAQSPCDSSMDCLNLNGTYECSCKPGDVLCTAKLKWWHLALIAVGVVTVIVTVVVLIIRR